MSLLSHFDWIDRESGVDIMQGRTTALLSEMVTLYVAAVDSLATI